MLCFEYLFLPVVFCFYSPEIRNLFARPPCGQAFRPRPPLATPLQAFKSWDVAIGGQSGLFQRFSTFFKVLWAPASKPLIALRVKFATFFPVQKCAEII